MSKVAAAVEGVAGGSDIPSVLLQPRSPAVEDSLPPRRHSRGRSSSHTKMAPHRVVEEELPEDRFNEPTFQQAFSDAKWFMSELTDVLSSSSMCNELDSTVRRLHTEAGNLARFHCSSTRTVGFVGDSGVGKYNFK